LIFDEPQQQSVEENAFREMLRHAQGEKNCQIIITTSQPALLSLAADHATDKA
jgi:hypothetical protein